jgi:hypothetical protein
MEDVDALLLEARRRYEGQRRGDNTLAPAQLPAWDELGDERRAALRALVVEEQMEKDADRKRDGETGTGT